MGVAELHERQAEADRPEEVYARTSPFDYERTQVESELGITHAKALERAITRFDLAKRYRRGRELTWYLCLAFYLDDHYAHIEKDRTALVSGYEKKVPNHRVRAVNNKITTAADELVARLVRSMPTLTANPATENPSDYDGALVASAILQHEWRRECLSTKDHEARLWAVLTGTAGIWSRWNQALGSLRESPEGYSGDPVGESEVTVVSPFHLYPDPQGNRYSNMAYMIHASEEDTEGLRRQWPELADKIGTDQLRRGHGREYEERLKALMGASLGMPYEYTQFGEITTLIHYYEPRSRQFPDGLMLIATPSVVLWMGPNPWAHWGGSAETWCPIEIVRYRELNSSFWGKGAVESAIPLQKVLNRTLSQILENRNECTNPSYWIPRGCKVDTKRWTGAPGERRWYSAAPPELSAGGRAYRPEREDPLGIPGSLFKLIADLKAELEDIFGYHQVSKGGAPPGVRSGVAIEQLQDKDEGQTGPIIQRHNEVWARVGQRLLTLAHDEWEDERIVEVRGDDGYTEMRAFQGADVPSMLNVTVDTDMMLPTTRIGRLNALLELVGAGVLDPLEARMALFGGYGTIRAAISRASAHQKKQQRENRKLLQGQPVPVDNFDRHEEHLEELNLLRVSPTYERVKDNETDVVLVGKDGRPRYATIADLCELHAFGHTQAVLANPELVAQGATDQEEAGEPEAAREPAGANAGGGGGPPAR